MREYVELTIHRPFSKIQALKEKIARLQSQLQAFPHGLNSPERASATHRQSTQSLSVDDPVFVNQGRSHQQDFFDSEWSSTAPSDWANLSYENAIAEPVAQPTVGFDINDAPFNQFRTTYETNPEYYNRTDTTQATDHVTAGLLAWEQADANITEFFRGCGHYFPFLDSKRDSAANLRSRSTILFNTICAVGCRAREGGQSQSWQLLNNCVSIMHDDLISTGVSSIEMIQALMIRACYSSERPLLISIAARLALELGLPEACNHLSSQIVLGQGSDSIQEHDPRLQKARTWLSILVLRLMFGTDLASSLDKRSYGDARRYRVLLDKPFSTELDLCLLEQLELNVIRAKIHGSLVQCIGSVSEEALMDVVRHAMIDIEVWFNDWTRILHLQPNASWLRIHLEVQRYWANITTLCWAVHASNSNWGSSGSVQREILIMAKRASLKHFQAIREPKEYIYGLRYATDFVWAKFVFCFLLLLDLSRMVPDETDHGHKESEMAAANRAGQASGQNLLTLGNTLLDTLAGADGISNDETCSRLSREYLQMLRDGISEYDHFLSIHSNTAETVGLPPSSASSAPTGSDYMDIGSTASRGATLGSPGWKPFVPAQLAFDWNFPYI